MNSIKEYAKDFFGTIPMLAEIDVNLRKSKYPKPRYIENLEKWLPLWIKDFQEANFSELSTAPKKIFVFSATQRWNPHTVLLSMLFSKIGHNVDYGFLPYRKWYTALTKYDTRKSNHYLKGVLRQVSTILNLIPLYENKIESEISSDLKLELHKLSIRDCQYTYQKEEIDEGNALFRLRMERNTHITKSFLAYATKNNPDIVVLPNGMVFEFGAVFQCCKHLNIPVTTYEFGEQQERIWLDQSNSVMLQNTSEMWEQVKDTPFNQFQSDTLDELYEKRKGGNTHGNFSRKWQAIPQQGSENVRQELNLDNRPIVLLAANVIGDSLTLGRQIFSKNMTDWILKTIEFVAKNSQVQLLVRIHPGEKIMTGPSVSEAISDKFTSLPEHIHIINAEDDINTYDLINITDLGLTYTTTVGMEMTMSNIPVIVSGNTHYNKHGFTYDPISWEEYFSFLQSFISGNNTLISLPNQVENSKKYAYHFFFTYPQVFPWHLGNLEKNYQKINFTNIFDVSNWNKYQTTFECLLGEKINWKSNMRKE
jgi:hypothetical protein